jgi:hypothetical protein
MSEDEGGDVGDTTCKNKYRKNMRIVVQVMSPVSPDLDAGPLRKGNGNGNGNGKENSA